MAAGTRVTFPENLRLIEYKLPVNNWSQVGDMYEQTVTVSGMTATQMVYVHNKMGCTKAEIEAFGKACITAKSQAAGSFILQAINKPEIELTIEIELGGECINGA